MQIDKIYLVQSSNTWRCLSLQIVQLQQSYLSQAQYPSSMATALLQYAPVAPHSTVKHSVI